MTRLSMLVASVGLLGLCACAVDETGYLQRPDIHITAEQPVATTDAFDAVVIGNPGAVEESGGSLVIESSGTTDASTIDVTNPDGSFVASVTTTLGETLSFTYDLDGKDTLEIQVDDDLSSVDAPQCMGCIGGLLFSAPDADGFTTIDLTMLAEPFPPFTLFNQTRGAVIRAVDLEPAPRLPASSGDLACIFRADVGGQNSAATCETVP